MIKIVTFGHVRRELIEVLIRELNEVFEGDVELLEKQHIGKIQRKIKTSER